MFLFEIIVVLLMLALNALFAAYEMALASIGRARLAALAGQKVAGAEAAAYMKERMEASLAVVQLGITLAGAIAAAVGGAGAEETFAPYLENMLGMTRIGADVLAIACVVVPLSIATVIFAELVPKVFAIGNNEWVCLKLSPAMRLVADFAGPVIRVIERIVKRMVGPGRGFRMKDEVGAKRAGLHELNAAATLARSAHLIGAREERIVMSAAQMTYRKISDIMLPAGDISMIPLGVSLMDALLRAHLDLHTRFPVSAKEGDPQTIEGYVNFKDIVVALKMSPSLPGVRSIMRAIKRFDAGTSIAQALEESLREKVHIALIVSKDGKVLGLVTLQDIIEQLVGRIEDEFDRLPAHSHQSGTGWIVGGGTPMATLASNLGLPSDPCGPEIGTITLADWVARQLGRQPAGGDIIASGGLNVVIRKLRRRKVAEAFVTAAAKEGPPRKPC
ncbi:MAG: hemolysin family protein [Elusimicrobiota bacterium]|jgi:putative hemolysin